MDIRGDVETRQRESLRVKGYGGAHEYPEAGPRHTSKPKGRQETEGGDRREGCGDTVGGGPAECKGGVETAELMV